MNSTERLLTFKVSLIMGVRMLGLFMLFPVMSVYASEYDNSTPLMIGLAIGIYGLTQAFFQIPFGYLSDRYGRKPLLILGLCIFFIGSILSANSTDVIFVVVGRALQGGGAIGGLIYNIYDLNSVFLLSIFVSIIWWFIMIALPHKVEKLKE